MSRIAMALSLLLLASCSPEAAPNNAAGSIKRAPAVKPAEAVKPAAGPIEYKFTKADGIDLAAVVASAEPVKVGVLKLRDDRLVVQCRGKSAKLECALKNPKGKWVRFEGKSPLQVGVLIRELMENGSVNAEAQYECCNRAENSCLCISDANGNCDECNDYADNDECPTFPGECLPETKVE